MVETEDTTAKSSSIILFSSFQIFIFLTDEVINKCMKLFSLNVNIGYN
jgi:hypothetical protein